MAAAWEACCWLRCCKLHCIAWSAFPQKAVPLTARLPPSRRRSYERSSQFVGRALRMPENANLVSDTKPQC